MPKEKQFKVPLKALCTMAVFIEELSSGADGYTGVVKYLHKTKVKCTHNLNLLHVHFGINGKVICHSNSV